jgi:large subunit ribosomal protein L15
MVKLNDLKPNEGAVKKRVRVGRGIGSGKGKTGGRGGKGQTARTGVSIGGFEGGQMPLFRRLPKFGFTNNFRKNLETISLGQLQAAIDSKKIDGKAVIDQKTLVDARLISKKADGVRLLGTGDLTSKVTLKLAGATATAKAAVEKAGGSFEVVVKDVKPVVRKKPKPA